MTKIPKDLEQRQIQTRTNFYQPQTLDDEQKTVKFVATTEQPAQVWDWERFDVVDEVLRMDGIILPKSGRVPLLDSHARHSVANILGSADTWDFTEVDGHNGIETVVRFASDNGGKDAFQKVRDGHLTDMSVGYRVLESQWIPDGERADIGGKLYTGPLKVATRWELKEVSLTPIGADALAKVRSEPQKQTPVASPATENNPEEEIMSEEIKLTQEDLSRAQTEAVAQERKRSLSIRQKCKTVGMDDIADELIEKGMTEAEASDAIFAKLAERDKPLGDQRIEVGEHDADKFRRAAADGLLLRTGSQVENPAPGADNFRGLDMAEIIRRCMVRDGVPGASDIAGSRTRIASMAVRAGTMSTSDFSAIFADVLNKTLLKAYAEQPATWRPWVNIVSTSDFKTIHGVSLSEAPNLELVKEAEEYQFKALSDNKESYAPLKYGEILPLTWEMVVNDDVRAFTRIPTLLGAATRRKESDLVYGLLTGGSNNHGPTLADNGQLFQTGTSRSNLLQTGKAITADNLDAARQLMWKQTGPKGARLAIEPRFLIVSPTNQMTTQVLLTSAASVTDEKNAGVVNPMQNAFVSIVESRLLDVGANNGEAWYLVADPNRIDTMEVAYLDGYQQPQIETEAEFTRDVISWKVRHVFGCGVMDYRGFVMNDGTA